jgi:hypothetical protein
MDTPESVSINPYAPPVAVDGYESPDAPPYQLYTVTAITLGGFLGGTLSATVLLGLNFFRLNRSTAAYVALAGGVLLTIVGFVVGYLAPHELPASPFIIGHTLLAYFLADTTQRRAIADHQRNGGRLASIWWAAGLSLVIGILQGIVLVTAILILDELLPELYLPSE